MKTAAILVLMLWALAAASQDVVKSPAPAECTFSDGSTITVTYSREQRGYRFSTQESVLSVAGGSVPAGDYMAYLNRLSRDHWSLKMLKPAWAGALFVLSLPMSVTASTPSADHSRISFDQTGGSCVMYLRPERSDTILSLVFTKKNMDLAVLP